MIQGAPGSLMRFDRAIRTFRLHMTDKTTERGEKRGVLGTGRAKELDKIEDADADADNDSEE